jgi:hypothetical protein
LDCPYYEQRDIVAEQIKYLERSLDVAYEERRKASVEWVLHLDRKVAA